MIGESEHLAPVLPLPVIIGLTLVIVAAGVAIAWAMYIKQPVPKEVPAGNLLTRAARQDLYQDTCNEALFMRPGMLLVSGTATSDEVLVDGAGEGLGRFLQYLGKWIRKLQDGYVRTYASYIVLGLFISLIAALAASM